MEWIFFLKFQVIEGEKDIFWSNADAISHCGFLSIHNITENKRFLIFDNCSHRISLDIEMLYSLLGIHKHTQHSDVEGMEFSFYELMIWRNLWGEIFLWIFSNYELSKIYELLRVTSLFLFIGRSAIRISFWMKKIFLFVLVGVLIFFCRICFEVKIWIEFDSFFVSEKFLLRNLKVKSGGWSLKRQLLGSIM